MEINNLQMLNIWSVFNNKFEHTNDIRIKWNIMEISKEIYDIKSRFDQQKDIMINQYGEENENGIKSLPLNDKHFQELLKCTSTVTPIKFENIDELKFSFDDMMILKPILTISQD